MHRMNNIVFIGFWLSVICSLALADQLSTAASDEIIQNRKGELCAFTATEPGRYVMSGMAKRPWYQAYCTIYVRSPPRTRIRLTFDIERLNCQKSMLSAYDGWRVFDWLKKKHYSLPDDEHEHENTRRQFDLCKSDFANEGPITFETSQNAGQVFYRFARKDFSTVTVEFIEDARACSVFISDKVEGVYKISNGGKSGVCKWYISGSVIATIDRAHLINTTTTCETSPNYFRLQSTSLSWRISDVRLEQRFCDSSDNRERLDYLLPCKYNRLELRTDPRTEGIEQWIEFSLQRPTEMEKEPFTYYCY